MSFYKINGIDLNLGDAKFKFYNIIEILFDFEKKRGRNVELQCNVRHSHKYYEIHFLISGSNIYDIGGKSITINSGELLIVPPEKLHTPFIHDSSFKTIVLSFSLENTEGTVGFYNSFSSLLHENEVQPIKVSNQLLDIISGIYDNRISEKYNIENYLYLHSAYSYALQLLYKELSAHSKKQSDTIFDIGKSELNIVLDNLLNNYNCTLSEIARVIGYSERNTSRLIYSTYKKSFSEIRSGHAIDTAKNLLEHNNDISISDVAVVSGFKSAAAMRNAFLKHENSTPTEYRRKLQAR